ncbi:hypothetical protein GCM10010116_26210 [Microbispora rosea subsp. aerata]|nr:DUF222 domain-containing protein [Microbispora rosea]GGO13010.1 hypothetical protein GCM10010116_26210 [Microbispora rosea subsp. aerata]GLJ85157.1 hypothetical protein GCM10017588_38850 [Microbispora rosea subsp. aerata]
MTTTTAGRLLALAVELARLPTVREAFTKGTLAAGLVEAICHAVTGLTDEQATLAEPILLELAGKAGPAEVAKAGRYLRAVLDPDGEERDEQAEHGRRFLRVRPGAGGGMEGEFYLPREPAARLQALLDAYAKPKAEGDDRPLRVRNADAFIALLEDKTATELLVLVSAESLPADPEPTDPADPAPTPDNHEGIEDTQNAHNAADVSASDDIGSREEPSEADDTSDPVPGSAGNPGGADRSADAGSERPESTGFPEAEHHAAGNHPGPADDFVAEAAAGNPGSASRPGTCHHATDHSAAAGHPQDTEGAPDAPDAEDTADRRDGEEVSAPDGIGGCEAPSEADDTSDPVPGSAGNHPDPADNFAAATAVGNPGSADRPGTPETCHPATAHPETVHTESADRPATFEAERFDSGEGWEDAQDAGAIEDIEATADSEDGRDREAVREGRRAVTPADDTENTPQHGHTQQQGSRSREPRWREEWRSCDPPGDTCAHHTHAGPRPARGIPHGPGHAARPSGTPKAEPKGSPATGPEASTRSGPGDPAGVPSGTTPGAGLGATPGAGMRTASGTASGAGSESGLGAEPGTPPGSPCGSGLGSAGLGSRLGVVPGLVPGLLLATGQVLPVFIVHRLARTSTLVRILMDADGQVLDMGRKVRLATPAQRRAIFARYATCWIDGCPLPATMCQIDHADNWSSGGLTDLKLLGPACQFHNRDRYRHPHRYTRRKVGKDRWAFTYHRLGSARRL